MRLLALLAWLVGLQDAPILRQEIVVTAERGEEERSEATAAITVLKRADIEKLPAENLGEVLSSLPGFHAMFATDFGAAPMLSTRGFFGGGEVEYVRLLVDGVPVGDAESGLADWRQFRTTDIERIEVARGPASSFYGDTAIGGVIEVFTRKPGSERTDVSASIGSFDSYSAEFSSSFAQRTGLSGAASKTEGFREHSGSESASGRAWFRGDRWLADVSVAHRNREDPGPRSVLELQDDRFGSDPLFGDDREETGRLRASVEFHHPAFRTRIYGSRRESEWLRTLLLAPGFGDRALRDLMTEGGGLTVDLEHSFGTSRLRGGVDAAVDSLETSYRGVDTAAIAAQRRKLALFVSSDWHPSSRVRLSAGLRRDEIRDRVRAGDENLVDAWSPRLAANFRFGPSESPYAAFLQLSRAFKAPTLDQKFDPRPFPDFAGGTFTISNPELLPQRAQNIEVGISRTDSARRWSISLYRMKVVDEIDFDPQTFTYRNIGQSLHRGIEIDARVSHERVSPEISYTWTRVEPLAGEHRGRQLKNIPEHSARAGLTFSSNRMVATAASRWIGQRFLDDANVVSLPDVLVLDLRLAVPVREGRVRLDLFNVGGENYTEVGFVLSDVAYHFPGAGFAARLGIDWIF